MPKPNQVLSSIFSGFKTFITGIALTATGVQEVVAPEAADIISPDASTETIVAGILMLILRMLTKTPLGVSSKTNYGSRL